MRISKLVELRSANGGEHHATWAGWHRAKPPHEEIGLSTSANFNRSNYWQKLGPFYD